ncbi:hypothetical protein I6A84_05805 [Frankia sp. CNm7]|uniref:Uncharacterized protein n=1 Tax=Frankia nepalensis TaxID=1836974 RepID=A0A937UVU3_9ACTN|nr:hypothetical protein [Frankia nepalensis]MBL7501949.1 hypothetical protein [Frankia nepalensis]MBL7513926.1 hypothetical protein [Frankia nepalensis]MBL7517651.1 hypothetical protein [Frankia nepalensis]MBL7633570.1 hypothetical protein [Frankia nepalensis]
MSSPVTYGHLADLAVHTAARAAGRRAPRPVEADIAGLVALVRVAGRHARLLSQRFGTSHPAARLADLTEAALATLPPADPPPRGTQMASPWHTAADQLALAHDLLAQQIGPDGQDLGPDARHLADRNATTTATGRVATLTALAAGTAQELLTEQRTTAPPGSPERTPVVSSSQLPPATRTLWLISGLAVPAADLVDQCGGPDRPGPLDDLQPLFPSQDMPVLDRRLEQLRLAAFVLSQPDASPTHHALLALADFAAIVAGQTNLALRPYSNPGRRTASPYDQASQQAVTTAAAWEPIARVLTNTVSLGTEGHIAIRLANDTRHHLATTLAAGNPQGLTPFRRAALILPDLAVSGAVTVKRLLGSDLLTYRASKNTYTHLDHRRAARLGQAYTDALTASTTLVARLTELPGTQPRPHLATHLGAQAARPSSTGHIQRATDTRPPQPTISTEPRWAEIHDRDHGTLRCPTSDLTRALRHTTDDLRHILGTIAHRIDLTGQEPHLTLAALTALHLPNKITPAPRDVADLAIGTAPPPPPTAELDL